MAPTLQNLILESSQRISAGISLHVFSVSGECLDFGWPSGHIELQFPPDLDPMQISSSKTDTDHRLSFTPCHFKAGSSGKPSCISILTRNGRITQLLGLPRLHGPLTADIVGVGGGFPSHALQEWEYTTCVASGTGIAPFLALVCNYEVKNAHLLYTMNGNDFAALEVLLKKEIFIPQSWSSVTIFITSGDEAPSLIAGKSIGWWKARITQLQLQLNGKARFEFRRMAEGDIRSTVSSTNHKILFCGNKSLEWQVRMWFLNEIPVYVTAVE